MPLIGLYVVPLLAAMMTGHASITMAFVSGLNAIGAGGDILAIGLLLSQVPGAAIVRNQGYKTYWTLRR